MPTQIVTATTMLIMEIKCKGKFKDVGDIGHQHFEQLNFSTKGIDELWSVQNNQDRSNFYRLLTTISFNDKNQTISVSLITTHWISDDIARHKVVWPIAQKNSIKVLHSTHTLIKVRNIIRKHIFFRGSKFVVFLQFTDLKLG